MSYPTFTYRPLTRTSYRVVDAHTGEEYGTITYRDGFSWGYTLDGSQTLTGRYLLQSGAAEAVYRARYAHGFEAGVL